MAKNKNKYDVVLLLILIFLGWVGIDKLYKGSVKLFVIKLLLSFIVIGLIWNIYDIICWCLGKYKLNPLEK